MLLASGKILPTKTSYTKRHLIHRNDLVICPYMAMGASVSLQYNGALLPDIIKLARYNDHRGNRLNPM